MKKMTLVIGTILLAAGVSHASALSSGSSATGTPLGSATPTNTSNTSAVYKQAVIAAQGEAVMVLTTENAQVTQSFVSGKIAAEKLDGVTFRTDREAAIAILHIANQQ